MADIAQLRWLPVRLAVKASIRAHARGVGVVAPLLAVELHRRIAPAASGVTIAWILVITTDRFAPIRPPHARLPMTPSMISGHRVFQQPASWRRHRPTKSARTKEVPLVHERIPALRQRLGPHREGERQSLDLIERAWLWAARDRRWHVLPNDMAFLAHR